MSIKQFETEVLELAVRKVRTPEGQAKYGLPIGSPITADAIANAEANGYTDAVPEDKPAKGTGISTGPMPGTISAQAASAKAAPKPAAEKPKAKLRLKIKKSSIKGNKVFNVGKTKYNAPNGSKLIRPASQPGMAYVVTPDGKVHAFNEAGEIEIPETLKAVFQNKFTADFEGDENYAVEEFDATAAPYAMEQLQTGAVLTDKDGTPQFKKLGADSWEHIDLGVKLKDGDLKQLYDDGDLVPEQDEDTAVAEETFGQTEATDFKSMSVTEAEAALDAMPTGQKLTMTTSGEKEPYVRVFTKQEDGTWVSDVGQTTPAPTTTMAYVKDFLTVGATKQPKNASEQADAEGFKDPVADLKQQITGEAPKAKFAPASTSFSDVKSALDRLPEGHEISVDGVQDATLTKTESGAWVSSVTNSELNSNQLASFGPDLVDGPAKPSAGAPPTPPNDPPASATGSADRPEPEKPKKPAKLRSTTTKKAGEGEYKELATPAQMEVATIGDKVLIDFAGGEMTSEYELTQQEVWENVDDPEDVFGKKTMAAMVAEQANEMVYINATMQSKPLSQPDEDSGEINYDEPLATTDVLYDPNKSFDVWSADSEYYLETGQPPYADETTLDDIANAQAGDKILVGFDPDFQPDQDDMANYMANEIVEKQPDGSWKNLTNPQQEIDQQQLETFVVAAEGEYQETQLYSFEGNSTKRSQNASQQADAAAAAPEEPADPAHPLIGDKANAKKIGGQAGSNEGGLYELTMPDGSKQKYYVKKAQSEDHGKNEALANALYTELGVGVPEVDYAEDGNLYSKIVDGEQDMQARLNDQDWLNKVREGFAVDAWLSNRDVFGLTYDNILTTPDGDPARIDNGGALRYRAMGEKKTDFGPEVTELEIFRTGKKAKVFGPDMTQEQELASAQKVADITPERIQELVSQYGMDDEMAQTLIARRQFIMDQYGLQEPAADVPPPPAADATPNGTVPPAGIAAGIPETAVAFDKASPPDTDTGDTIYELTANGNLLTYKKKDDGQFDTDLGDGLLMDTAEDEIYLDGPATNQFFYQPAAQQPDAADETTYEQDQELTPSQLDGLPVGATVTYKGNSAYVAYTRVDENTWNSESYGVAGHLALQTSASQGMVSYGDFNEPSSLTNGQGTPELSVGATIFSVEELDALPASAVVSFDSVGDDTKFITKLDNGSWLSPNGHVLPSTAFKKGVEASKFKLYSTTPPPETTDAPSYAQGETITKMGHVNQFPVGQKLLVKSSSGTIMNSLEKTPNGWVSEDDGLFSEGQEISAAQMGNMVTNSALVYTTAGSAAPEAPEPVALESWNDLDTQLWQGAPAISKYQISTALESLENHPGFQVSYGLKKIPKNHPLASAEAQEELKTAALNKYPDLKAKPAVVQYLKDAAGIEPEQQSEPEMDDSIKVSIGSKSPKNTGVQGVDGGEFSMKEIQQAIDILEAYNGKLFKAELNKKNNPLGALNPNSIVGFDKDKTVVKQKFIDLLKAKLIRTEESIKHPKITSTDDMNALPVGTKISWKTKSEGALTTYYSKVNDSQWVYDGYEGMDYQTDNPTVISVSAFNFDDAKEARIEAMPDVLPDYAKTPAAVQDKEVSETEVEQFGPDDLESAPTGTVLMGSDVKWGAVLMTKDNVDPVYAWTVVNADTGQWVAKMSFPEIAIEWEDMGLKLKPMDGPNFNQNADSGIVPGKYESKTGAAYMVVNADGTGVYVNSKGTVSKLSKNAVKKNYDAGVANYKGMPDNVPTPGAAPAPKKAATVANLPDGTYFAGDPNNPKTLVYEINGDTAKVFKPDTGLTAATGVKLNKAPNEQWLTLAGVGARFETANTYKDNPETGGSTYFGRTYTVKGADGLWTTYAGNSTATEGDIFEGPVEIPKYNSWSSSVTSHGMKDPVEIKKEKVNSLFAQGILIDQYGSSVLPEGYTGSLLFLGSPTTVPTLAKTYNEYVAVMEQPDFDYNDLNKVLLANNLKHKNDLLKKWRKANGFEEVTKENVAAAFKMAMENQLAGLDTTPPESNAAQLFEWDEMGYAVFPASVAAMPEGYSTGDKAAFIKAASMAIGDGKIIGQHYTKMDKYERQYWINAFKAGNFKAMYEYEVAAAAKEGKPHNAGFLHPGYEGFEATHQINWGPAVKGEISAKVEIEGDWSSTNIDASMAEINNYLIKAQMQNPTFLTPYEKRTWVRWHRQGNKSQVDSLSSQAQQRKLAGDTPSSEPISWTDDVQPAKVYDHIFENASTPFPPGSVWKQSQYHVTTEWAKDNMENPDFKAYVAENYPMFAPSQSSYVSEEVVAAYFDKKLAEYEAELLKPVYTLGEQISLGSHEVWFATDQFDRKYVFKPADSTDYKVRLQMEGKANELAKAWGFNAARTQMGEIDGKFGLIQEFVPSQTSFAGEDGTGLQMPTLNNKQLAGVAAEHVLDWMLDNDDTHPDNLLLKNDGSVVGIDKGRAFYVYGNWDGITGDSSAHTNAPDGSGSADFLVYTRLYNDIREGKLSQEQIESAYFGARKAALKIQNSSDATVEQLVREAVEGRENWDVPDYMTHFTGRKAPSDPDSLVKAVLYRKNHLAEQIDTMWSKIYADAGLGDLPQAPPKPFENQISGWDDPAEIVAAASEAKVWGATALHSNPSIVNGSSLMWTEQDGQGNEIHKGEFTMGGIGQKQLVSFLSGKAQAVNNGNGYTPNKTYLDFTEFPNTGTWKSSMTAAAKNITNNAVDKAYDEAILANFQSTVSKINTDLQAWAPDLQPAGGNVDFVEFPSGLRVLPEYLPQYKLMLEHYLAQAAKVTEAKDNGGTTTKSDFTVFQALAPKTDPQLLTAPDGAKYTQLANGQWLKSDGALVEVGALPVDPSALPEGWISNVDTKPVVEQAMYTIQNATGKGGTLSEGGLKVEDSADEGFQGHQGKEYRVSLPTGEVIMFRNADTTSTYRSQQGRLSFRLAGDDRAASLARVQAQLETMGLDMAGSDEDTAQLQYWRAMFNRVIFSNTNSTAPASVKKALEKLRNKGKSYKSPTGEALSDRTLVEGLGLNMEPTEELSFYQELANEAFGAEKVSGFIASEQHLPKYHHMDLANPELATGKPYYSRIDFTEADMLAQGNMLAIGNNGKDESLLKYITSGGMLSTEERLRVLGYFKTGASSSSDQGTGGASGVFTRIAASGSTSETNGAIYGAHVAYWSPTAMAEVGTYSYTGDEFGNVDNQQSNNKYDPTKSLKQNTATGNETLVGNTLSIVDHLEIMVFENAAKRNEAIQRMKQLGFEMLRGLPIEERLIMRVDLTKTIAKVKAQWTK